MKQTYQVNIGISEDTREQIAIGLGKVLADTYTGTSDSFLRGRARGNFRLSQGARSVV